MLNSFWNWFVIIITVGSILGCWWLLHWTKGVSDRSGDDVGSTGHTWDEDLKELNTPLPRWWLHLFNITIIFALVYLVLFPGLGNFAGVLGCTQEMQFQEEVAAAEAAQEAIYARYRDMGPAELKADSAAMETASKNAVAFSSGSRPERILNVSSSESDSSRWTRGCLPTEMMETESPGFHIFSRKRHAAVRSNSKSD